MRTASQRHYRAIIFHANATYIDSRGKYEFVDIKILHIVVFVARRDYCSHSA